MCFMAKPPPPMAPPPPPPIPASPVRSSEENKQAVDEQLEFARRRRGRAALNMTGGLGDPMYGSSIARGGASVAGTTLG